MFLSAVWTLILMAPIHCRGSIAEKVTSLGKDWHKFCLKCERCNKTLNPGGHAEHDGKPYCHKPCYAALYGPKGVNIGGAGSYVYDAPVSEDTAPVAMETKPKAEEKKATRGPVKAASFSSFSGQPNICPRCNKTVYFAEKVSSLGKDWHRPCLRCERCSKTLAPGSHAEVTLSIERPVDSHMTKTAQKYIANFKFYCILGMYFNLNHLYFANYKNTF
uniref:Cysteine-rich protein 2-like n=1 Tax=Cyprinus carpio TaxID=7962 RepID=A0A8C1UQE4_CYPCA